MEEVEQYEEGIQQKRAVQKGGTTYEKGVEQSGKEVELSSKGVNLSIDGVEHPK